MPNTTFFPYGRHCIDDNDIKAVIEVLKSDWLTTGPVVNEFEKHIAKTVGAKYAVVCSSGTAALHLSTSALLLKENDSVIVPAMTFLATANAVRYVGADVIFSDSDPENGLMRIENVKEAVSNADRNVKALIPVHLNGQCADMAEIYAYAKENGWKIIEDASHALGTEYLTKEGEKVKVGSCRHSDLTVFSFHPVKTVAMGEGGAVTTNDSELYERLKLLRNHGMTRESAQFSNREEAFDSAGLPNPWYYEMQILGYNYRASDINCALGLSQLKKLPDFISKRRKLVEYYDFLLKDVCHEHIKLIKRESNCNPGWHLYVVLINYDALSIERSYVINELSDKNIGSQVHYFPVNKQPYYSKRNKHNSIPGTEEYYKKCLSLPLHPTMTSDDVKYVVLMLLGILGLKQSF